MAFIVNCVGVAIMAANGKRKSTVRTARILEKLAVRDRKNAYFTASQDLVRTVLIAILVGIAAAELSIPGGVGRCCDTKVAAHPRGSEATIA